MGGSVSMILIPWGPTKVHEWIRLHRSFRNLAWSNLVFLLLVGIVGVLSPLFAAPFFARRGEWVAMMCVGVTSWLHLACFAPALLVEWRDCRKEAAECLDVAEWLAIGIMPPQWSDDVVSRDDAHV